MSTATPQPALPKHPTGKTFIIAMGLLALFALVQVIGTLAYYAKDVKKELVGFSNRPPAAVPAATPLTVQKTPALAPTQAASAPSAVDLKKVQKLLADVDYDVRIGEYETALKALEQVEALQPGDPMVLLKKAAVYEQIDQTDEAVRALDGARRYGLPVQIRAAAERKLDQLSRRLAENPSSTDSTAPDASANPGEEVRENGIQPGSTLGIVDIQLRDVKSGVKGLRVAVKSLPNANINVKDVKVVVYFYEQTEDGDITLTESKPISQWLSPPIDWAADEPELLEMQYTPPAAGEVGGGRKYHGYVVGIYYNGELQDLRADRLQLARDFALPLYLKQGSQ